MPSEGQMRSGSVQGGSRKDPDGALTVPLSSGDILAGGATRAEEEFTVELIRGADGPCPGREVCDVLSLLQLPSEVVGDCAGDPCGKGVGFPRDHFFHRNVPSLEPSPGRQGLKADVDTFEWNPCACASAENPDLQLASSEVLEGSDLWWLGLGSNGGVGKVQGPRGFVRRDDLIAHAKCVLLELVAKGFGIALGCIKAHVVPGMGGSSEGAHADPCQGNPSVEEAPVFILWGCVACACQEGEGFKKGAKKAEHQVVWLPG